MYIKSLTQECFPCLLFGIELFTLSASQLSKLERWFLKNRFAPRKFLFKLSNLNSIESEPKITPVVLESFFKNENISLDVLPSISC